MSHAQHSAYELTGKSSGDLPSGMDVRLQELESRLALMSQGGAGHAAENKAPCDPGPIGMIGFAIATIMLGYTKAGFTTGQDIGYLATQGFFLGGLLQLLAGLMEAREGGYFGAMAFLAFGCSWMANGVYFVLTTCGVLPKASPAGELGKAFCWMVFSLWLFIFTLRVSVYHIPMLFCVWMIFVCEMIEYGAGVESAGHAAGWFAMTAGMMAFLLAFAINVNHIWGRQIFNYGAYRPGDDHLPGMPFLP